MLFLFPLFAFCVGHAFSQSNITLWQFGANRLLGGQVTLPLFPVGTATDSLSTTYLYEVADAVVTVFDEGTPVAEPVNPTTRTIVASASGWIENFGAGGTVQCNFISEVAGECFDAASTAFGTPTPVVIPIASYTTPFPSVLSASTVPMQTSSLDPQIISPTPTSASSDTSESSRKSSVGAIVGISIAGLLVLCVLLILFLWLRRHRVLDCEKSSVPGQYSRNNFQDMGDLSLLPNLAPPISDRASWASSTRDSLTETTTENSTQLQLQWKVKIAREELHSLQHASINALHDDNSHGKATSRLQDRMIDILERLKRLEEEQRSINEPPPNYVG